MVEMNISSHIKFYCHIIGQNSDFTIFTAKMALYQPCGECYHQADTQPDLWCCLLITSGIKIMHFLNHALMSHLTHYFLVIA